MDKHCFKCGETKPFSHFYKHKGTADGHLGKCMLCAQNDTKVRERKLRKNAEWVEKEKARKRIYNNISRKNGRGKPTYEQKKMYLNRHKLKYPEKLIARSLSGNMSSKIPGNELHHWSYNVVHARDVIEIEMKSHKKIHRFMTYDQPLMMYRTLNGELLDTKEKHERYIHTII